jgi:hypothetical protein
MICSVKPVLTEDWCVVQKEELNNMSYLRNIRTLDEKPSTFIRDKPFSSERMLHEDYYARVKFENKSLDVSLKGPGAKTNWLAVNRQS